MDQRSQSIYRTPTPAPFQASQRGLAPPVVSTPPASIPDTSLGLSREDVAALRQHQQLAHQHARSSAGSQASSRGRLLLDPTSLGLLGRHLERVMAAIQQRLEQVCLSTKHVAPHQREILTRRSS